MKLVTTVFLYFSHSLNFEQAVLGALVGLLITRFITQKNAEYKIVIVKVLITVSEAIDIQAREILTVTEVVEAHTNKNLNIADTSKGVLVQNKMPGLEAESLLPNALYHFSY